MANKKIYKSWIFLVELAIAVIGLVVTILSVLQVIDNTFSILGVSATFIALGFILVLIQMREEFDSMKEDLQVADSLYKKRNEYLTLGELNDIEQKFGKDGNIDIYIVSNDLSTETIDWKEIIEKNLLRNVKYFYLTNEKNKEHFNGIFKDLKEKRGLKDKNLQDNFSISLNNCLFKFLPKFSEIVIYRDNNKSPIEMRCFVSYTNKGEKELYKEMDNDFSDTIWKLVDDCIKNNQNDNCVNCNHELRCKKHAP